MSKDVAQTSRPTTKEEGEEADISSIPRETPNFSEPTKSRWRFWAIFPGLCLASALCALDSTILATALPTIVGELHSSSLYIWTVNGYTLTFTAVQPLYGQAADIFGRKPAICAAVLLFLVGSCICATAHDTAALIGGRAVQGLGGGGLSILPAMVVCDLVPLRDRQMYTGIIYAAFAIGTFIGPVVGGALVDNVGWRWIFWVNVPVSAVALGLIVSFLRVHKSRTKRDVWAQLLSIDYFGNLFLVAAVTSILLALSAAGSVASWASWRTLVPLLLGIAALPAYLCFENSRWCANPTTPIRLFAHRTSCIAFGLTFLHGLVLYWVSYFLPVYFQAVLLATPQQSGIDTLAAVIPMVPTGILGGVFIAKTGRYKPNQVAGFALMAVATGCFSLLDQDSGTVVWVVLQIVLAVGAGLTLTALLPAIQAPLPESDVGASTATWGFVQSLGFVWGVAVPSSVFDSRFGAGVATVGDEEVRRVLGGGNAYEHASREFVGSLMEPTRGQVIGVFVSSLRLVWLVGAGFAALGVSLALMLREVKLRETLETDYGFKEQESGGREERGCGSVTASGRRRERNVELTETC